MPRKKICCATNSKETTMREYFIFLHRIFIINKFGRLDITDIEMTDLRKIYRHLMNYNCDRDYKEINDSEFLTSSKAPYIGYKAFKRLSGDKPNLNYSRAYNQNISPIKASVRKRPQLRLIKNDDYINIA